MQQVLLRQSLQADTACNLHRLIVQVRRTRAEMHRAIDADYYGFRDEEDGILEKVEAEAELTMRRQALEEWQEKEAERQAAFASVRGRPGDDAASAGEQRDAAAGVPQFVAYVPLPDQKEIEQKVLESKKQQLLKQYISTEEAAKQQAAKELLNRR
jgi:pre-mRNA-splicing factor ISY1